MNNTSYNYNQGTQNWHTSCVTDTYLLINYRTYQHSAIVSITIMTNILNTSFRKPKINRTTVLVDSYIF